MLCGVVCFVWMSSCLILLLCVLIEILEGVWFVLGDDGLCFWTGDCSLALFLNYFTAWLFYGTASRDARLCFLCFCLGRLEVAVTGVVFGGWFFCERKLSAFCLSCFWGIWFVGFLVEIILDVSVLVFLPSAFFFGRWDGWSLSFRFGGGVYEWFSISLSEIKRFSMLLVAANLLEDFWARRAE